MSAYNKKIQVTSGIFHGTVYQERALHNYFIPCFRKYSGQHNQCDIPVAHGGNFLWHDLNFHIGQIKNIVT